MSKSNTRRFVSAAWSLLTFQLIASAGAVAVTAWAAFQVQPRLAQIEQAEPVEPAAPLQEAEAPSEPPPPVQAANTGAGEVAIRGEVVVGGRAQAMFSADPDGMRTRPSYQWLRDGEVIAGASGETYAPTAEDAGHSLAVRADYIDGAGYSESVISAAAAVPQPLQRTPMCQRVENSIRVPANIGWCDTGIVLQGGQSIVIRARGRWSNLGEPRLGPEGMRGYRHAGTVMADADLAALIGRVGDAPFAIGAGARYAGRASGPLHLSMNDVPGTFEDNQGFVDVFISSGID